MRRTKFIVGGMLILAAVVYLIFSATKANAEYFMTVDELKAKGASIVSQDVRISGAVVGDTIQYDANTLTLSFDVAQVPGDQKEVDAQGGLAAVLPGKLGRQGPGRPGGRGPGAAPPRAGPHPR